MYELSVSRPHERRDKGYTPAEYRLYCEGYYHAIAMALKVMDVTCRQWNGRLRRTRAATSEAIAKKGAA